MHSEIAVINSSCSAFPWQFRAVEFRLGSEVEAQSQLLHCLYIYPQSVNLSRKRSLFVRVELRRDDGDIRKPPLEVIFFIAMLSDQLFACYRTWPSLYPFFYTTMLSGASQLGEFIGFRKLLSTNCSSLPC